MIRMPYPIVCLAFYALFNFGVIAAVPEQWDKSTYAYDGIGQPVSAALQDFANSFGVELDLGFPLKSIVKTKIHAKSANAFMKRMALQYRFQWFIYNGVMHISPLSDQHVIRIEVSKEAVSDLKTALTDVGLIDSRFGWGELTSEGIIMVSGPLKYVQQVKKLSKKTLKNEEKKEIMIFPLKYASVADRKIEYRNSQLVIPGIASVLSSILSSSKLSSTLSGLNTNSVSGGSSGLGGRLNDVSNLMPDSSQNTLNVAKELSDIKSSRKPSTIVSADIRNNYILIRDNRDKRMMYQKIINKLDIQKKLIEISAIILDIDRLQLAEFGANWQLSSSSDTETASTINFNALGTDPFLANGTAATILINNFSNFMSQLRALEGDGDATIVATPTILTIENQPAVIDLSETVYITATGERVANVQSVTAGISLQVTPRAIKKGDEQLIKLEVDIEDGRLARPSGSDLSVRKSTISTQALMNDDRALVLGGFNVSTNNASEKKIPFLGDIPLLGAVFRYEKRDTSKRERLFILSPRIISLEDSIHPASYVRGNKEIVREAVNDLHSQRNNSKNPDVSDIKFSLREFAKKRIPDNFQLKTFPKELKTSLCYLSKVPVDFTNGQYYQGRFFDIAIGAISLTNRQISRRFDEADCSGKNTIAVAAWPSSYLKAGSNAEVFIVLNKQ